MRIPYPFFTAIGALLDSGNYQDTIAHVIKQGKLASSWRGATRRAQARLYGIGLAIVEPSVSNMGYIT